MLREGMEIWLEDTADGLLLAQWPEVESSLVLCIPMMPRFWLWWAAFLRAAINSTALSKPIVSQARPSSPLSTARRSITALPCHHHQRRPVVFEDATLERLGGRKTTAANSTARHACAKRCTYRKTWFPFGF